MSVTLIATGGTIASTRGVDGSVSATRSGKDLLDSIGDAGSGDSTNTLVDGVDVIDLSVPGSWNLSTDFACTVIDSACRALRDGADGVVITHGTDVLEETAWLGELIGRATSARGALVFTGSMRHFGELGGDGPRNLADSLVVAADPRSRGRGALVCVNGELHHSRWVTKTHATAVCTFASPGRGPVGHVDTDGVRFVADSPRALPAARTDDLGVTVLGGPVPLIATHWDADPGLLDWYLDRGAAGLVIEGGGAGNVNGGLVGGIEAALRSGIPVVVATRCRSGEVTPTYGGRGGFATLAAMGAINSHGLTAGKARLALLVALGIDADPTAVRRYFDALEATQIAEGTP